MVANVGVWTSLIFFTANVNAIILSRGDDKIQEQIIDTIEFIVDVLSPIEEKKFLLLR